LDLDALIKNKTFNWTDLLDTPSSIVPGEFVMGNDESGSDDLVQFDLFGSANTWTADQKLSDANQLQFRDSAINISSIDDGHLDLTADINIDLNAPVIITGTNYLQIGSGTTYQEFYMDEGDIYSDNGKAYFGLV